MHSSPSSVAVLHQSKRTRIDDFPVQEFFKAPKVETAKTKAAEDDDTNEKKMEVSSPYEPDEEERTLYYRGIPSCPRLVARTSSTR
jgi:hypothetical protein